MGIAIGFELPGCGKAAEQFGGTLGYLSEILAGKLGLLFELKLFKGITHGCSSCFRPDKSGAGRLAAMRAPSGRGVHHS